MHSMNLRFARQLTISFTVAVTLALAACGGGGGSSDSTSGSSGGSSGGVTPPPPPPANVVPTTGTLQTSAPAPTYTAGSDQLSAYTVLNTARQSAGAGVLVQSTLIDAAANGHATYLGDNLTSVGATHTEQSGLPGYYADTLDARLTKAGYQYGLPSEVLDAVNSTTLATGGDCVADLLNTVYHLSVMLSPATQVGVGTNVSTAAGLPLQVCVVDMSTAANDFIGQIPASGGVVGYPYANETNVPATFQPGGETPRVPVALVPNLVAGTPIAISLDNADYENLAAAGTLNLTLTTFTLTDASGNLVPAAIVANPAIHGSTNVTVNADTTGDLVKGSAVMVPLAALNTNATYTVTVVATMSVGGTPLNKTWSFTTGAN